jgi:hypothetical protein
MLPNRARAESEAAEEEAAVSYWVVVDIGCIECGAETTVLGVFTDQARAKGLATGEYFAGAQHSIECFEVPELDVQFELRSRDEREAD